MNPWIENISLDDIATGRHFDAGPNSMLIQICDPDTEFPVPKYQFKRVSQYKFLDVEDDGQFVYRNAITDQDAINIAADLIHAYKHHMNVVVHCHMGICRSGAVAEVGVMMGFQDTGKFRNPNLMVKHKLMQVLGMHYNPTEIGNASNGPIINNEDWL